MNYLTIRLSVHHPFEASSPSLVDSTTLPVSVNKKHSSRCRRCFQSPDPTPDTPNLPTNIVDFGGSDSSVILIQRGGILMSKRDFPESLSQAMLVGTMLVGRLGVLLLLLIIIMIMIIITNIIILLLLLLLLMIMMIILIMIMIMLMIMIMIVMTMIHRIIVILNY